MSLCAFRRFSCLGVCLLGSLSTPPSLIWAERITQEVAPAPAKPPQAPASAAAQPAPTAPSAPTQPVPAAASPAIASAQPKISSVTVFQQAATSQPAQAAQPSGQAQKSTFVIEIKGTAFDKVDLKDLRVLVFPATDVGKVEVLSKSSDNSTILAQFTAPMGYALEQVALSLTDSSFAFSMGTTSCDFNSNVTLTPQITPNNQSQNKYGNGVAANFHVIQLSIVNKCTMPIVVPLAGIRVIAYQQAGGGHDTSGTVGADDTAGAQGQQPENTCKSEERADLVPLSLDHVTSVYSTDRKLTGGRAIYFNILQALATLGSGIEPFFAHGFTQGVSILGGAFTTASKDIFVDMSAEQLQNLTAQSFGSAEQISAGGSLQKFAFILKNKKCKNGIVEQNLRAGNFSVELQILPASGQSGTKTENAKPVPTTTQGKSSSTKVQK